MNILFAFCLALAVFFVIGNLFARGSRRRQTYSDLTEGTGSSDLSSMSGDSGHSDGYSFSFSFSHSHSHSHSHSLDTSNDSSYSDGSMSDGSGGDGGGGDGGGGGSDG
ncbi:MAG TPA: hypothetical protein VG937_11800 [Polyangiaceae bacterium]|nr:hypothetical protein [Polyangiaceae bacterium]